MSLFNPCCSTVVSVCVIFKEVKRVVGMLDLATKLQVVILTYCMLTLTPNFFIKLGHQGTECLFH